MPSILIWAPWPTSTTSWPRRAGAGSRSRSTLPCSVRPIILGPSSTPSGSASGPTEPSSTPRIRPRSIRTSTPSTSTPRTGKACIRRLLDVVLFWVKRGVRILRVDNPHTKPVSFWEWLIARVHRDHPDVLFLAEAFTRPKRMKMLAKVGLHPVVQLLHLAQHAPGAGGIRHRAVPHRHGGLPAAELLRQHARHPARVSAERGTPGLHGAPDPGRDPVAELRHLQRLRAVREPRAARRAARSTWTRRSTSTRPGTGTGPGTSRSWSPR